MEFTIPKNVLSAIESQTSLIAAAQFLRPSLAELFRAQEEMSIAARAFIETQGSMRRLIEMSQPFRFAHELESMNAVIRGAMSVMSDFKSLTLQNTFIEIQTEAIRAADILRSSSAFAGDILKIRAAFFPTLDAFSAFRESMLQRRDYIAELKIPSREHFLTTDLLHEMIVEVGVAEFSEERAAAIKDAEEQLLITLPDALSELNPSLYDLWRGAWESLISQNPDRMRHTLVSARELVSQVLHALAPDDEVRAWSDSPEHYDNNRPKRSARLHFIFRNISDPVTKEYFQKETDACVSLIRLLNQGTHEIVPSFSDTQLRVMLRRVHSLICTLVEIRKSNNRNQ